MKNKLKELGLGVFQVPKWIIISLICLIIIVPYFVMWFYLRKQNKQLIIYPKFEIKEITNNVEIDLNLLGNAVNASKSILKKLKLKK